MLYTVIPYSPEKNLVKAYNQEMERVPNDNDFLVILDHDVMFTTYQWYNHILFYINKFPECGCFLGTTNRINPINQHQCVKGYQYPFTDDMRNHWITGIQVWEKFKGQINDYSEPYPCHFSGFLMVIKKTLWKKIGGFKPWDNKSNILGIDSRFHEDLFRAGEKVYVMMGIYLYHVYRFGNINDKSHLL